MRGGLGEEALRVLDSDSATRWATMAADGRPRRGGWIAAGGGVGSCLTSAAALLGLAIFPFTGAATAGCLAADPPGNSGSNAL